MTKISADKRYIRNCTMSDCKKIDRSAGTSMVSKVDSMDARVLASIAVLPEMIPPAFDITCYATSNTAIVIFIVFVISVTATKVLKIHFQKIQVSKFARLLWLMTSWISS